MLKPVRNPNPLHRILSIQFTLEYTVILSECFEAGLRAQKGCNEEEYNTALHFICSQLFLTYFLRVLTHSDHSDITQRYKHP